jgi:NTP pyrophosphatase (non-canonical NTP hydrolase)
MYMIGFETAAERSIVADIINELKDANKKHGGWPDDVIYGVAIMVEEAGESIRAAINLHRGTGSQEELEKELIQTGAMCIGALMHIRSKSDQ